MKIWKVTEACSFDDGGMDVSSFTKLAYTFEEASKLLKEMVETRVKENIVPRENYSNQDNYEEDRDIVLSQIINSGDGYGWYRYKNDTEAYGWNVSMEDFPLQKNGSV